MLLVNSMLAAADPLDQGEAYTTRSTPPQWMDNIDLSLLLLDYGIFAMALIALGWLLFKKPDHLLRLERWVHRPFRAIFTAAKKAGGVTEFVLQVIGGAAIFVTLVSWVFFCQWLKHVGIGALAMIGLALLAVLLVRAIKNSE